MKKQDDNLSVFIGKLITGEGGEIANARRNINRIMGKEGAERFFAYIETHAQEIAAGKPYTSQRSDYLAANEAFERRLICSKLKIRN